MSSIGVMGEAGKGRTIMSTPPDLALSGLECFVGERAGNRIFYLPAYRGSQLSVDAGVPVKAGLKCW